jgi:hypothetical protein
VWVLLLELGLACLERTVGLSFRIMGNIATMQEEEVWDMEGTRARLTTLATFNCVNVL